MTRHRKPNERIDEILDAASAEILERGYAHLSMEGITRRVELSKGGVYRFFRNREDVALALFTRCYDAFLGFDVEEAAAWGLPIDETVLRVIYRFNVTEAEASKVDRIWLNLVPMVLEDRRFMDARTQMLEQVKAKMTGLWALLMAREGLIPDPGVEQRLESSLLLGIALIEGLTVQSFLGTPMARQEELTRMFVGGVVSDLLDGARKQETQALCVPHPLASGRKAGAGKEVAR